MLFSPWLTIKWLQGRRRQEAVSESLLENTAAVCELGWDSSRLWKGFWLGLEVTLSSAGICECVASWAKKDSRVSRRAVTQSGTLLIQVVRPLLLINWDILLLWLHSDYSVFSAYGRSQYSPQKGRFGLRFTVLNQQKNSIWKAESPNFLNSFYQNRLAILWMQLYTY